MNKKVENLNYQINCIKHLPGLINITFPDIDGKDLVMQLDLEGIAISYGAACASGSTKSSSLFNKLGLDKKIENSTVRISFGKIHSKENIETVVKKIKQIIKNQYLKTDEG